MRTFFRNAAGVLFLAGAASSAFGVVALATGTGMFAGGGAALGLTAGQTTALTAGAAGLTALQAYGGVELLGSAPAPAGA